MIEDERVLAVIPARGGSKRCPGKNLRFFRGKSLIAWAIQAAYNSKYIDEVVVSSEDKQIQELARTFPHVSVIDRPKELATDTATNEDVLRHALLIKRNFKWVVLLQPTSPLRTAEDIDNCLELALCDEGCVSFRKDGTKNGAVYVAKVSYLKKNNFDKPFGVEYIMPSERSLDIDFPEQFDA